MMKSQRRLLLAAAMVLSPFALDATASAAESSISAELKPRLAAIEAAWGKHDPAAVSEVYSPDVTATGQDTPGVAHGRSEVKALVTQLMDGTKGVHIEIYDAKQLSPGVATSWVTWNVASADPSKPDFQTKSLFVWQKEKGVWVISRDMFAMGPMKAK